MKEWLAARFPRPDAPELSRKLPVLATRAPGPSGNDVMPEASKSETNVTPTNTPPPLTFTPPQRRPRVEPLSSNRFALQVTVSRSLRDAIELARDLMRHRNPSGDLEAVLEAAVRGLIEQLERDRFKQTQAPRRSSKRVRHGVITASTRRAVRERDGLGCSFVSPDGHRCGSRAFLEYDHVDPVALGGSGEPWKVRLLCRAHNQLEAERAYGREYVERKRRDGW